MCELESDESESDDDVEHLLRDDPAQPHAGRGVSIEVPSVRCHGALVTGLSVPVTHDMFPS